MPVCASKVEGECKNWCSPATQSPKNVPTGFYPRGKCLKICKLISFTYNPVISQTTVFAQGLGMSASAREPPKKNMSDPRSPPVLLVVNPIDFQSLTFLGLCLSGASPKDWGA